MRKPKLGGDSKIEVSLRGLAEDIEVNSHYNILFFFFFLPVEDALVVRIKFFYNKDIFSKGAFHFII